MMLTLLAPTTLAAAFLLSSGTTTSIRTTCPPSAEQVEVLHCGVGPDMAQPNHELAQAQPVIDVVFVLDTTGSMGGLIEGAKQKIWSIANEIAQTQPAPKVRMGLIGYRDRGDDYIVRETQLTEDLDTIYADLMKFQARGGGDTPESVNEALYTAVERFDWSDDENALKLIYLVGDAPPKMNYQDDVKYHASCKFAMEKGIFINTIQCGSMHNTRPIWEEIAQLANGSYAAIQQDGGVQRITTPYDESIRGIDQQIRATMIDYGNDKVMHQQSSKRAMSREIVAGSSLEAQADRAAYNYSEAGEETLYGLQELVNDYANGKVKLEEIKKEHLPESMQDLSLDELRQTVERKKKERDDLRAVMDDLAAKRNAYISEERKKMDPDGFDIQVVETLKKQAALKGIEIGSEKETTKEPAGSEPQSDETPKKSAED